MRYSIITINYNNKDGLRRTIESVVSQTCRDFEYIIIDGGSTDGSADVIAEYADRITYWVSERDKGIYNAMNKGVKQAHGDYCLFLNSGDVFYDIGVLERLRIPESFPDIVVGKLVSSNDGKELFRVPEELTMYHLYSSTLPHQASFIRTSILLKFPYDESLRIVSDWKFFVETIILHQCSVFIVDEIIARFDMTGVSTSNNERTWQEKEAVMRNLLPPRVLDDYKRMKESECLTQTLTPQLRKHYRIDKILFSLGKSLLKL